MSDVIALEEKIDAIAKLPSKMSADQGKVLKQAYNRKITKHQVPVLIEDAKVIKAVPLALRVADKTESQSMRSSRVLKPAFAQQVSQTISAPSTTQVNFASSIGSALGATAESIILTKSEKSVEHPNQIEEEAKNSEEKVQEAVGKQEEEVKKDGTLFKNKTMSEMMVEKSAQRI